MAPFFQDLFAFLSLDRTQRWRVDIKPAASVEPFPKGRSLTAALRQFVDQFPRRHAIEVLQGLERAQYGGVALGNVSDP